NSQLLNLITYLNIYLLPLIQLLSPLIPILVIFYVIKSVDRESNWEQIWEILKNVYGFKTNSRIYMIALFIWMLAYFYAIYTCITNAILQYKVIYMIHLKLYHLTEFKRLSSDLFHQYHRLCQLAGIKTLDRSIDLDAVSRSLRSLDQSLQVKDPPA